MTDQSESVYQPLAARLRPLTLDNYIGQQHLLGPDKPLRKLISSGQIHSLILWGPPGTGKTSLAHIIAHHCNCDYLQLSAVTSNVKEIRQSIAQATLARAQQQRKTLLFVDEVHRFNKSQQDAFLPVIEDGTIVFIGATTENPAFEINNALLSRARVYVLQHLTVQDMQQLLQRAIDAYSPQLDVIIEDRAKKALIDSARGDARNLLNILEICVEYCQQESSAHITTEALSSIIPGNVALYDKGGDAFYDLISAFHKSVRGSDPDAALYWMCRILEGGGDPLYIARRLLAIASEDIGNADPRALEIALNAWDTFHRVGSAEGERAIAQACVYLALAPKSNAVYNAFNAAREFARNTSSLPVPDHLRNATSKLTRSLGHGVEYRYAHNEPYSFAAGEHYFPDTVPAQRFYYPSDRGLETKLRQKREFLDQLNAQSEHQRYSSKHTNTKK